VNNRGDAGATEALIKQVVISSAAKQFAEKLEQYQDSLPQGLKPRAIFQRLAAWLKPRLSNKSGSFAAFTGRPERRRPID
jgi:hypothetical protein